MPRACSMLEQFMTPGERIGPYLIEAPLGEGGMGAVYRARDTRLDRSVAIKVSKAEFSERHLRFQIHL